MIHIENSMVTNMIQTMGC